MLPPTLVPELSDSDCLTGVGLVERMNVDRKRRMNESEMPVFRLALVGAPFRSGAVEH